MDGPRPRISAARRLAKVLGVYGPDDPRIPPLREDLAYEQLAEHIDQVAPGLPPERRAMLAARMLRVAS